MAQSRLVEKFTAAGGHFVTPAADLAQKLDASRAFVFDWDGVFNDGRKGHTSTSGFSEVDSMGTNMLRYGMWRRLGELPYTAIISGEDNESASTFAEREHLTAVYTGIRSKQHVVEHLCGEHGLEPGQIACVFDDINDLPMARTCGIRLMVRRSASPLFAAYVDRHDLCDYVTGATSGSHPVREVCELSLGLMEIFDQVVESRVARDEAYEQYFRARQAAGTRHFGQDGEAIVSHDN